MFSKIKFIFILVLVIHLAYSQAPCSPEHDPDCANSASSQCNVVIGQVIGALKTAISAISTFQKQVDGLLKCTLDAMSNLIKAITSWLIEQLTGLNI
ncbi:hypothetical protein GCK72_021740 [Caenorhabditis remanei]|uniref:Uncharacterized protein n=1 Tax=Caenorhabditis remanei TaxID=31234 RepID=A0A6A5GKQ4_CAERE|nr:hypothetical protein GCK72_021740 [Caenorhabditis remanei]KAF1755171.1 hypothetical protein GCK72_021740 [Caenorhabditis remanei]